MNLVLLKEIAVVLVCYAVGCFASGYYWVRWRTGLDIRNIGSGSVGAKNVGRVLGPWGFIVTLAADVTKGVMAVALANACDLRPDAVIAAMMGVVIGHTWPVQLRFHGGKGIATSLGALLVYDPRLVLILGAVFIPVWIFLRSFTLSGLIAYALSPLAVFFCRLGNLEVAAVSLIAIVVLFAHQKNIREEFARLCTERVEKEESIHRHKESGS
jgi:acyl phosphate:glycerol-3-phosphate acyltransferase